MDFFSIVTLGCKVNQYESQAMRETWLAKGWQEAENIAQATVVLINSCAITKKAVADVRATIRRVQRDAPDAKIILAGCAVTVQDELTDLPEVAEFLDNTQKAAYFFSLAETPFREQALFTSPPATTDRHEQPPASQSPSLEPPAYIQGQASQTHYLHQIHPTNEAGHKRSTVFPAFAITDYTRSRAVLKIQDGCSHFCSYCIVPYTRGASCSRPLEESFAEAERLIQAGFGEIIISGVNLRQYSSREPSVQAGAHANHVKKQRELAQVGKKYDFWDFIELLEKRFAPSWAGKVRFRISSLEPGQLTERAIQVLGSSKLLAPHLHLSLQSGSPTVLQRMNRGHYHPATIKQALESLQQYWPTLALGADFISGFPAETEAEHDETVELLQTLPFTYAHIFPFSSRPNTPAADMAEQISANVKKERAKELRAIATSKQQNFMKNIATLDSMRVAVEKNRDEKGRLHGINDWYVPCVFEQSMALERDTFGKKPSIDTHGMVATQAKSIPVVRQHTVNTSYLVQAHPIGVRQKYILVE